MIKQEIRFEMVFICLKELALLGGKLICILSDLSLLTTAKCHLCK